MTGEKAVAWTCALSVALVLLCEDARAWDAGWRKVREPAYFVTVMEVADAKAYCAPESRKTVHGCYMGGIGMIFLQAGLAPSERACALRHEKAHAAGWDHGEQSTLTTRPSCGPEGI